MRKFSRVISALFLFTIMREACCGWTHDIANEHNEWTEVANQEYQVIEMDRLYTYKMTNSTPEFRLIPVEQVPETRKFSYNIISFDPHAAFLGVCFSCHVVTQTGLRHLNKQGTQDWEMFGAKDDITLPPNITNTIVRDRSGKKYFVLTIFKWFECPSLTGTHEFSSNPIPWGIKFEKQPTPNWVVMVRSLFITALIMLPTMYLLGFKDYWSLSTKIV